MPMAGAVGAVTAGQRSARRRQANTSGCNKAAPRNVATTLQMEGMQFSFPKWGSFAGKAKDVSSSESGPITSMESKSDVDITNTNTNVDIATELQFEGMQFKSSVLTRLKQQAQGAGVFLKKKQQAFVDKVQTGIKMTSGRTVEQQMVSGATTEHLLGDAAMAETQRYASWMTSLEQMGFEHSHIQEAMDMLGSRAKQIEDVVQVLVSRASDGGHEHTSSLGASSSTSFKVTLNKCGEDQLGIRVDLSGSWLVVEHVEEGLVSRWNAANPKSRVKVGDRILDVNGTMGQPQKLVGLLAEQTEITMTISSCTSTEAPAMHLPILKTALSSAPFCTSEATFRPRKRRVSFKDPMEESAAISNFPCNIEAEESDLAKTAADTIVVATQAPCGHSSSALNNDEPLVSSLSMPDAVAGSSVDLETEIVIPELAAKVVESAVLLACKELFQPAETEISVHQLAAKVVESAVLLACKELFQPVEAEISMPEMAAGVVKTAVQKHVEQECMVTSPKRGGA